MCLFTFIEKHFKLTFQCRCKVSNTISQTKFQINSAISTDRAQSEWVNLGVHLEICMTHPESCGAAGGAISVWFRIVACSLAGAVVTTVSNSTAGYHIYCDSFRPPTL